MHKIAKLAVATALYAATSITGHAESTKPTIVLVHGAFADSSSWNLVVSRLEKDGYPVLAVANPLRGVKSDGEYVAGRPERHQNLRRACRPFLRWFGHQ